MPHLLHTIRIINDERTTVEAECEWNPEIVSLGWLQQSRSDEVARSWGKLRGREYRSKIVVGG
jgi:hypothetical protein